MKYRFGFLLAEFLFLKLDLLTDYIEDLLKESDDHVFMFAGKPLNSPQLFQRNENIILNLSKSKQMDGLLVFSNSLTPFEGYPLLLNYLNTFKSCNIVSIGESFPHHSSIQLDNFHSIQTSVQHLYEHGLRDFAYIGGPSTNHDAYERFKGVVHFLDQHAIQLSAIYEGDFSYEFGESVVNGYFNRGLKLPEAFICANDEMAIGAFYALTHHGVNVPNEVKLVGFDDNDRSKHLDSPLTTINQGFPFMVHEGLNLIKSKTHQNMLLPGNLVVRESCGCLTCVKEANQEYYEKKMYIDKYQKLHQSLMDNLELQAQLSSVNDNTQLKESLKSLFAHYQNFDFNICLFKENVIAIDDPLEFTFPKVMNCFLSFTQGHFYENIEFNSENILPESILENYSSHVFYVYPLRMSNMAFGYIVCSASTAHDRRFVSLKDLLNISLNRIEMQREINRYKMELENLSFKDSLTMSYNHRGFHHFASPLFRKSLLKGKQSALIYCDVNHLKLINDTYGHANGDIIIIAASELLNTCFPNEIVARIGGDEFIVFISDFSSYEVQTLTSTLDEMMSKKSEELNKEFVFKMSFGFSLYDDSKHHTLDDMIREADMLLYEKRRLANHYYLTDIRSYKFNAEHKTSL